MKEIRPERPVAVMLLALMLLVSGGCALVFQVVWIRELRLVFGATTAASAAVLAIFMAGLGLGNALLGKRIDQSLRPLRFYGLLEAGIAFSVAISPLLISLTRTVYISVGGQSSLGPGMATVTRLLASAMVLALPTFLMGGTMPAAARAVSIDADSKRRGVAFLYGLNTLGAVIGAGLANFTLLETFGNRTVLWSACLLNILLAAVALGLSSRLCKLPALTTERQQEEFAPTVVPEHHPHQFGLVCTTSGIVGFVFFLMEIVWYRMLGPLLGGTTYTFGLILCVALLGIGVGGASYSFLARWLKPSFQLLASTCAVEACLIAIPFWYGDRIALWVLHQQGGTIASFGDQVWNWFQVGAFVILPPSVVAGFQFPLLVAIAGTGRRDVGKHVGLTFAANSVGAICGSLAGGFLLLPILTAPGVWQAVIWVLVALAVVIAVVGGRWSHPSLGVAAAAAVLTLVCVTGEGPTAFWRHSGIGAGRAKTAGSGRNTEQDFIHTARRKCLWEAEGVESSVAITATDSLSFIVNGKTDGNAFGDAGTQIGLGLLGPLLHESPKSALVIGLGTGETGGWIADVDGMSRVDVVELEPAIVHMAELCAPMNRNVLQNSKVHLYFNDAREFLLTVKRDYDLIVSEPSNPYRAGVASLYTRDFYEIAANRLAADGLFLQWLQGYEVDDRTVNIVLQTLRSVFPNIQVWRTMATDMVLVCGKSTAAFSYDAESLRRRINQHVMKEALNRAWGVDDVEGVLSHFVCGDRTIDKLLNESRHPLNSDDRNLLEYAFAKTVGQTLRFSLQELGALAGEISDDSPFPAVDFNRETLLQRRLALHLQLGDEIPRDERVSAAQRTRAESYALYLARRYPEAAAKFQKVDIDTSCAIETVAYAHSLAAVGSSIPDEIMDLLKARNRAEAAAVEAIGHRSQGRNDQAVESILTMFKLLHAHPWGSSRLFYDVLRVALVIANTDAKAALQFYNELNEPFAMYRLEDERLILRYLMSEQLGEQKVREALELLEPNVPWNGRLLKSRARVYATGRHPLAEAAKRDLQQYQTWAESGK